MKKFFFIVFCVFSCFLFESAFSQVFGRWFSPNLLIILIVFLNLIKGIRYSLAAAVLAGLLKDSYSPGLFGISIFSFTLCAYLTTIIKMYVYHPGAQELRFLLVFLICLLNIFTHYFLALLASPIHFGDMFLHLLVPEVIATTLMTGYTFKKLKQCALNLFV